MLADNLATDVHIGDQQASYDHKDTEVFDRFSLDISTSLYWPHDVILNDTKSGAISRYFECLKKLS